MIGMSVLVICLMAKANKACYVLAVAVAVAELIYNLKHLND